MKTLLYTLVALLCAFSTGIAADEKPTVIKTPDFSLEEFRQDKPQWERLDLAIRLASLPAEDVTLQGKYQYPEGEKGFETVFREGNMEYTCRLSKTGTTAQNRLQIFFNEIGRPDQKKVISDLDVDGHLNDAKSLEAPGEFAIFQSRQRYLEERHPSIQDVVVPKGKPDTEQVRREALAKWNEEYRKVTSAIRQFVFKSEHKHAKRPEGGETRYIRDAMGQAVVILYSDSQGKLFMDERTYDALGRITHRNRIVLAE